MKFLRPKITRPGPALAGYTLIEAMVFLFLFALISMVFVETYSVGTRLIIESKNRLGATALANQKMEIIRSIDYAAIGTTTGIPVGSLAENETISVNTVKFTVHTFVQYVDDTFDGTAGGSGASKDTIPTDYKRVRVTVSWGELGTDQTVVIFGNFSPKGVETSSGGGVLSINILDGSGAGVSGASVHIVNATSSINTTGTTDSTGNLTLPGAPAGTQKYTLTVSKSGYYGATTYPPYPTSAFNPVDVHASVVANVLNQKTMMMDQASDLKLTTKDPFGTTIPSIGYTITGGRVLGVNPLTSATVYGFTQSGTTDASGEASYPNESRGQYTVTISNANYDLYKLSPESPIATGFTAIAGSAADVTAILLDKNIGSLKVIVNDQGSGNVLSGASVHVSNSTLGYDATVSTDQYGIAYFPTSLPALANGTYDIVVTMTGYSNASSTASISGALQTKTINMTP